MHLKGDRVIDWNDPSPPTGITPEKVYFGPDPFGLGGFQVAVASASATASRQALRDLFTSRKGKTQTQLLVAVVHGGNVQLCGPDPQAQPIELPVEQAERQLQSVLAEPDVLAATERLAGFRKASGTTGVSGFTNSGLFATHHIMSNVPKRTDWGELSKQASPLLGLRRTKLVEALGFSTQPGPNGSLLLSVGKHPPRAVAVLLEDSEQFDTKTQRFQLSPVAFGLALASRQELPWLVVLRKDQIRLYPGRDGVGLGSKGQAETFFEVDLSTIDAEYAALLPLIFSATALTRDGTAEELLRDSGRYATELGQRLRERIYDELVPPLAEEVAWHLANDAGLELDAEGLSTAYRVTLRILFRLLFQAYAEDRGLLPSGRNEGFDANSLKTIARRLLDSDIEEFGSASTLWFDLVQVWNAVDQGNPQWQIPTYNGGLFATDPERSPEGALIKKIELPDNVMGPALKSLLIDVSDDGVLGPVDFRSLSVREFGTIYEGLLESSLSLAEIDLTLDSSGAWVPAGSGDEVVAPTGAIYFHTASGERKATGSYFTPKVVVDHLVERSIVPALSKHLERIAAYLAKGDAAGAAREFFDFRVADLAMGSGHFLVAAVDKIEALMRTFLAEHSVPGVIEELLRLAAVARDALGTDDVAKSEVDEIGLLRRQIARRCIYGLDINPMAVELARLALWIHTFVPGLPMSNLDHGLVTANSLTGIGVIDEALDALQPDRKPGEISLFDEILTDQLASAKTLLVDVANASEANKSEVDEGARLLAEARQAADTARQIFDAAVAARMNWIQPGLIIDEKSLQQVLNRSEITEAAAKLAPAHMPYLFPEVFLRSNPGFDVLIGNPPWEELHIAEHHWWGLRLPGLRSTPQAKRIPMLKAFRERRPDLEQEYERDIAQVEDVRRAIAAGPYAGVGAAHLDLYQMFAWRNWQLVREGGRTAVVLPRGALSGASLAEWRKTVLSKGSFADVCFLLNNQQWVFPEVHPQYTIGLTVTEKGGDRIIRWCGPFANEKDFRMQSHNLASVPADEFVNWSDSAAFPLLPDTQSAEILRQMMTGLTFGSVQSDREFALIQGDMNATKDRKVFDFDVDEAKGRIAVTTGAGFNLWNPDAGLPYAYSSPKVLRPYLADKFARATRTSRSAYSGMKLPRGKLQMDKARIAYRGIARATDTRTAIVCLLPPGRAVVDPAHLVVTRRGSAADEAFLLGVMASIPFDWSARRWVELHLTFGILKRLPIPWSGFDSAVGQRVRSIAGRLAACDDRYTDWASEVGVPVGSVKTLAEKDELITELDALVALLYGLSDEQVEHLFATFHRGWNFEPRLEAVLKHFQAWKAKA